MLGEQILNWASRNNSQNTHKGAAEEEPLPQPWFWHRGVWERPPWLLLPRQHPSVCSEPGKWSPQSSLIHTPGSRGWAFQISAVAGTKNLPRDTCQQKKQKQPTCGLCLMTLISPFHVSPRLLSWVKARLCSEAKVWRSLALAFGLHKIILHEVGMEQGSQAASTAGGRAGRFEYLFYVQKGQINAR